MIHRRYLHFVFGVLQSGLTSCIAAAIASHGLSGGSFVSHWLRSWLVAWAVMLPVVVVAAPAIRALAYRLTHE